MFLFIYAMGYADRGKIATIRGLDWFESLWGKSKLPGWNIFFEKEKKKRFVKRRKATEAALQLGQVMF